MKKILILAISTISLFTMGCSDFLEEDTSALLAVDNFYSNEKESKQALNGIYKRLNNRNVTGDVLRHVPTDLTKRAEWDDGGGLADYTFTSSTIAFGDIWSSHYAVIKDCNTAITNINGNKDGIDNWERYIAQARGVRAYLYFNLVRFWGDVPLILVEYTSLEGLEVARTPKEEVFQAIIDDLKYCEENSMEKDDLDNGYQYGLLTKGAAQSLLAKVHLWLASVAERDSKEVLGSAESNYQLALDYSEKVIKSGKYSLAPFYPDVFSYKTRSSVDAKNEIIWPICSVTGDSTGSWVGMMFGIGGTQAVGGSWTNSQGTDYHRTIYEKADSVRRLWNCTRMQINSAGVIWGWDYDKFKNVEGGTDLSSATETSHSLIYTVGKFRRIPLDDPNTYNYSNFGMTEPVLRYSDILLVYAEAYNEVHKGPGAYTPSAGASYNGSSISSAFDAVNLVRRRARGAINGIIHDEIVPRDYNMSYIDDNTCVSDWQPGSYGMEHDGTLTGELNVWDKRLYSDDYTAFRNEILYERARELVAEGTNDRWCDLVRRGLLIKQMTVWQNPNPYLGGESERNVPTPKIDEHHYLLPIPQGDRDSNEKLTQNPGY